VPESVFASQHFEIDLSTTKTTIGPFPRLSFQKEWAQRTVELPIFGNRRTGQTILARQARIGFSVHTVAGFQTLEDTQERLAVNTPTADLDRSSRDNSVRNSIAITEMEGGQPSAYCREQLGLFADGKISVTEMRDRVVLNASR
jgi:hypothetical protein